MRSLLTIGLLLAASLILVSSTVEEEGSGVDSVSPGEEKNTTSAISTASPSKVARPDDTVSESGSGDDDEDAKKGKVKEEASGEGSGYEPPTTAMKATVVGSTAIKLKPSTKSAEKESTTAMDTTHMPAITDKESTPPSTKFVEDVITTERAATTSSNEIPGVGTDDPNDNNAVEGKVGSRRKSKRTGSTDDGKKTGLSFTVGIITGVVIGAILAILIILFLVYRLRKKDEGSYALGDPATGFLKDEPGSPVSGKEYFA